MVDYIRLFHWFPTHLAVVFSICCFTQLTLLPTM